MHLAHRPRSAAAIAIAIALLAWPSATATVSAASSVTVDRDIHFETVQVFPGNDCGPATTEIASGNSHLVVVDDDGMFHVDYMETFHVVTIWEDGTVDPRDRQGTDALHFNLTRGGTVTFHESFHDFGPAAFADGDVVHIQLFTTFVAKDGVVRVDHFMGRDLPPDGC